MSPRLQQTTVSILPLSLVISDACTLPRSEETKDLDHAYCAALLRPPIMQPVFGHAMT